MRYIYIDKTMNMKLGIIDIKSLPNALAIATLSRIAIRGITMIAEPRVFVISIKGIVELSENRENLSFL